MGKPAFGSLWRIKDEHRFNTDQLLVYLCKADTSAHFVLLFEAEDGEWKLQNHGKLSSMDLPDHVYQAWDLTQTYEEVDECPSPS